MGNEVHKKARETATKYRQALKYLDAAKELNADVFLEANRIAGDPMSPSEIRRMIDQSESMLPIGGKPGGLDALRETYRDSLVKGISTFDTIADRLGAPTARKPTLAVRKPAPEEVGCIQVWLFGTLGFVLFVFLFYHLVRLLMRIL